MLSPSLGFHRVIQQGSAAVLFRSANDTAGLEAQLLVVRVMHDALLR
ncbi:MAG: hypothetical protein M0008_11905 [Actinomycetota bacterium]|nr:hypothetical protein [Actinomycetota bacterium]